MIRPLKNHKLNWHKAFAWFPKRISGEFLWFKEYWRKGTLVDAKGDHVGSTIIMYNHFHTDEEHFAWTLTGEEDEIIDETFWNSDSYRNMIKSANTLVGISKQQSVGRALRVTKNVAKVVNIPVDKLGKR